MFWGLIMEPNKRYSQTVRNSFHVSMAALDPSPAENQQVQVMLCMDNKNYLLCTLNSKTMVQTHLDLIFEAGDKIAFISNGKGHVHLTGYLVKDDFSMLDSDQNSSEEESDEVPELVPVANLKRKGQQSDEVAKKKKRTTAQLLDDLAAEGSDDDETLDFSDEDLEEEEDEDDEDDDADEDDENEEDETVDSDDEVFEGENDDSEESEDEDESEEESKVPEMKKKKKNKNNQPQQNVTLNGTPTKKEKAKTPKGEKTPKQEKSPKPEKSNQTPKNGKSPNQEKSVKTPKNSQNQNTPKENKAMKNDKTPKGEKTPKAAKTPNTENKSPVAVKKVVEGGVHVEDLKVGTGPVAKAGKFVQVYYEGRLKSNGKQFDASNKGPGFKFRLGKREVIQGWDIGVAGMRVGGKRRITCPPNMAYGAKGSPPVIPPNSTLVFDVELKSSN